MKILYLKYNESNVSSIIQIIINWFLNIFNKIKDYYKNQIILINDEESESNYNILEENKIEQKLKKNEISTKANEANKENKGNNTDEYEIDENQANNFIVILEKNKFIKKLYGILTVILNSSIAKAKYYNNNIIENIYDIITEYIKIKPKEIEYFLEEEKNQRKIITILITSQVPKIRKSSMNFIKKLLDIIKEKNNNANIKQEDKIDIQSPLLICYFGELISEEVYYEEFYELYNYLLNIDTVKPDTIPIDKIIEKTLDHLYNYYINMKNANINLDNDSEKENLEKINNKIKYNLYILNCYYKQK